MNHRKNPEEPSKELSYELDDALNALFGDENDDIIGLTDSGDFPEYYAGKDTVIMTPDALSRCGVLDDDDIVELTDKIGSSEDDEGIQEDDFEELTDLIEEIAPVEPSVPDAFSEAVLLDDDDVIELIDIVTLPEDESDGIQEDDLEELIDLIEKVAPAGHTLVGEDTLGALPAIMPEPSESETEPEPEPVILLTDILDSRHPTEDKTRMDMDADDAVSPEKTDTRSIFPEDAIEAAVERYILKKYGPEIREMMARTIEQKVIHEIENLKQHVLEDEAG